MRFSYYLTVSYNCRDWREGAIRNELMTSDHGFRYWVEANYHINQLGREEPYYQEMPPHAFATASASRVRRVISSHRQAVTSALSTIHDPPMAATIGNFR